LKLNRRANTGKVFLFESVIMDIPKTKNTGPMLQSGTTRTPIDITVDHGTPHSTGYFYVAESDNPDQLIWDGPNGEKIRVRYKDNMICSDAIISSLAIGPALAKQSPNILKTFAGIAIANNLKHTEGDYHPVREKSMGTWVHPCLIISYLKCDAIVVDSFDNSLLREQVKWLQETIRDIYANSDASCVHALIRKKFFSRGPHSKNKRENNNDNSEVQQDQKNKKHKMDVVEVSKSKDEALVQRKMGKYADKPIAERLAALKTIIEHLMDVKNLSCKDASLKENKEYQEIMDEGIMDAIKQYMSVALAEGAEYC
jgi:hypothetical protein